MASATRLESCFVRLRESRRTGLIAFMTAGYPDAETSALLLDALVEGGADIVELGMPFSDPMADGVSIQAASVAALRSGMTLAQTLSIAEAFRARHAEVPLVLMGYYNPIYHFGAEAFAIRAAEAGVDGLIVVDLPPEEEGELRLHTDKRGLHWVRLLTPTSSEARLAKLLHGASGFLYYVAVRGITGTQRADELELAQRLAWLGGQTQVPLAVGFGLRTAEDLAALRGKASAAVVGSALIERVAAASERGLQGAALATDLVHAVRELRQGLDG